MRLEEVSKHKVFNGWNQKFSHYSNKLNCKMTFSIYLPTQASHKKKIPALYWLSGLTCTDDNFMQKAGAQCMASELGIAIISPDTSPRGHDVADDNGYDLGQGAGFYVNATQQPWKKHYQMYDYIVDELPEIIESNFPISDKKSISGHSMGGHGALTIAMRNPNSYMSASAFSPICNPINCTWGKRAFNAYFGDDKTLWEQHDASVLMRKAIQFLPIKVDQGKDDSFMVEQLKPETLVVSAKKNNYPIELAFHEGFDHSYYFISSFIDKHILFHTQHLQMLT
ncbi:MAG: S-formylglutathione hydrolase [Candidatus Endonucleobacter bathymodioli]|uniref:S-formylglutathione hydrolase n=1 Tax=Candidatus Endonucleibacter bathymodioli TaxID=539814 RepID=A0AA90NLZ9_9GAMM|nr:S-formylglutathione hydrolase [Candidatus Endonucleobacter bathymodioli]